MPIGDPYATLAELKGRLGITDTIDDARLTDALAEASVGIEKWCRRQFNDAGGSPTPRVYYPTSGRLTLVDDFSTTTGLDIKTDQDDDGVFETTWAATDRQLEPLDGIRDGQPGWPFWKIRAVAAKTFPCAGLRAPVQVTARWGWAAVPKRVHGACLVMAEEIYKLVDAPFGAAGIGDLGVIRIRENTAVQMMLASYRRTAVRVA